MRAEEIRTKFLEYFQKHGHTCVQSAPLIPKDDPSLLFTNAGMVQFKKTFLDQEKREYLRATTSQKCLRVGGKHNDLENVGKTARHHTFFEMLGNFSFGDYFKEDAIRFCWEFLTKEIGLPKEKLYISVFREDDEAARLWKKIAQIEDDRIYRMGEKDNFWTMGDTGPCGPCSEVYFDQGEAMACGAHCEIGVCDCDRFLEIWNLVFMQYDQAADGNRSNLPKPSIDTGMGLERIAAVCQGVRSNYETDLFTSIIEYTAKLAGVQYKENQEIDTALQVIADHSRAIAFLIPDQVLPSNEGRGYVLRRLIRRAYRFGRTLGFDGSFLHKTAAKVVADMKNAYPELEQHRPFMEKVVLAEEEQFAQTLDKGLAILEEEIAETKATGKTILSGEAAFKLYDTYGFPLDIVKDIAEKIGFGVDEQAYIACMAEQKERAKAAWKGSGEKNLGNIFQYLLEKDMVCDFVGYESLSISSHVSALLDTEGNSIKELAQGEAGWVIASKTPFYGESGGQTGDIGTASTMHGLGEVLETVKPSPKLTAHKILVNKGTIKDGTDIKLTVDQETRAATQRNHTATHLLHAALKKVLGTHVNQSGSLVSSERLRFDFTHIAPMSRAEIEQVEKEVNRAILQNIELKIATLSLQEAQEKGATALFGEKYGEKVRVVDMPDVSMELCGGTHLKFTGEAGSFIILSETGIAAGVRRIEAATGWNALEYLQSQNRVLNQVATLLKNKPEELPEKVQSFKDDIRNMSKEIDRLQAQLASSTGNDLINKVEEIKGIKLLASTIEAPNQKIMREQMDALRSKLSSGIIALVAAHDNGKVSLLVAVSKDLQDRFKAGELIKHAAAEVGGGGGGRPDMAQAGGSNPQGIPAALDKIRTLLKNAK